MILYEYEAKSLLRSHGVTVPSGGLDPHTSSVPSRDAPLVVKVQMLEGKRGKRGGVRIVRSPGALAAALAALYGGSDLLPPAELILIEEFVAARREIYLALLVDRDAGHPVLLVSPAGGVDIEEHSDTVTRLPVSILAEQLPEQVKNAAAASLGPVLSTDQLSELLDGLWACFREEECLLLEVNPCAEIADGTFIAVDAKITVDANARRHAARADDAIGRTTFEAGCAAAGVSATELDGDIAIIVSGAGLAMATLDLVVELGGHARCVVDLGYSTLQSEPNLRRMLELVYELEARVVLVNGFLQMASCAVLAASLVSVAAAHPTGPHVVARLAGNESGPAQAAVVEAGGHVAHTMVDACRSAVTLPTATDR